MAYPTTSHRPTTVVPVRDEGHLRIAMNGQKGLPATWGGIEHHVEEIGARLADRGHEVLVYCRPSYSEGATPATYRGMRLVRVPTVGTKHLDTITHSAACTAHAVRSGVDVIHYHAVGPGLMAPLPRYLSRAGVVLTVHGLDGERAKWGSAAQRLLRLAERLSAHVPDTTVVVSRDLQEHYATRHGRHVEWISNGVDAPPAADVERVRRYGLEPGRYLLFVGRFVPEKCPDLLVRAFARVPGDVRLVMAGGSSFSDEYTESVAAAARADPRVLLPGYVYGEDLGALYAGAAGFVLPSQLEGLPLTLLEAVSHGTPVVASSIPPHVEVVQQDGPGHRLFPADDADALCAALVTLLNDVPAERAGAQRLRTDVLQRYRWDSATDRIEQVYRRIAARR